MTRRVVITGMGTVNPLGLTLRDYWQGLLAGKSGVGPIESSDRLEVRIQGLAPLVNTVK